MKFLSLAPFIPSGPKFEESKQLFTELGFEVTWDSGDYAGFRKDACHFILQHFDNRSFAENLMVTVNVDDVSSFREMMIEKSLPERFGIRISDIKNQPYGREVNVIDLAGVCWHFVQ